MLPISISPNSIPILFSAGKHICVYDLSVSERPLVHLSPQITFVLKCLYTCKINIRLLLYNWETYLVSVSVSYYFTKLIENVSKRE